MPTRLRGVVLDSSGRTPQSGIQLEAYDPATGFSQGTATTDANGSFTLSGLEDRSWVPRRKAGTGAILIQLVDEAEVEELIHGQRATLSAHGAPEIRNLPQFIRENALSIHQYVFVPDAAKGATVVAGDQQGTIHHSGPAAETATRLYVDAETAPGASGLPITVQYADTDDLDTAVTWTTIATLTLSSEKSAFTDTVTNATIPANRLLRMNVGTIVGTPSDVTVTLRVKRPLSA